jgi:hypothetical protein
MDGWISIEGGEEGEEEREEGREEGREGKTHLNLTQEGERSAPSSASTFSRTPDSNQQQQVPVSIRTLVICFEPILGVHNRQIGTILDGVHHSNNIGCLRTDEGAAHNVSEKGLWEERFDLAWHLVYYFVFVSFVVVGWLMVGEEWSVLMVCYDIMKFYSEPIRTHTHTGRHRERSTTTAT